LDEAEQNITQEVASIIRRLESHAGRSEQLSNIYNSLLNAQSEIEDATASLRQFIDRQSFDPERMEQLNTTLEIFHRLARKHRTQPELLKQEYETWQQELEQLHLLEDPETLAEQVEISYQIFMQKAEHLDQIRRAAAVPLAKQLTEQVKPLALPEAYFEFKFEPMEANAEGLSFIQLLFTANKGIPPQPLARVASGGELSRIALVMQVMNAEKQNPKFWSLMKLMSELVVVRPKWLVVYSLIWLSMYNYSVSLTKLKLLHNLTNTYWSKNNKQIQQAVPLLS
jgi:DNA repair protein RecN (Recombination protein N)